MTCQTEQQLMVREIEHGRRRIARTHMRPVTTIILVAPTDDIPADVQGTAERIDAAVTP